MKKRAILFILALFGSFFIFQASFSANSDIIINEIGAYAPSGHEWIEIWNKGSEPVDMAGWKFWENNINHSLSVSTTDAIVGVGEYAVITQDAFQFLLNYPNFSGSIFDSSWSSLNESGEYIGLKDSEGNFIEQFIYVPAAHFSLQRKDPFLVDFTEANWVEHYVSNTVGSINFFLPTSTEDISTSTSQTEAVPSNNSSGNSSTEVVEYFARNILGVKINEFVSDPDSGSEWVELFNTSGAPIELTGSLICDSRSTTSTCKKITGVIGSGAWLFVDLQTKSFLNNAGDSVVLRDAMDTVVDRIEYEDDLVPDEDQSLARVVDGVDTDTDADWAVTNSITPGVANSIHTDQLVQPAQKTVSSTSSANKKTPSIFIWNITVPSAADVQEMVVVSAEDIADPRGGRLSFLWTLEGGQQIAGPEIRVSFVTSGIHTISLFVTSTSGYGEEKKIEIIVGEGLSQQAEVVLSEIFPNPEGQDSKEFVELQNNSMVAVNVAGWFLKVGDKKYTFVDNTMIAPGEKLVFYKAATKISLVNTVGKVELFNKDKVLVDLVKYEKPVSGKSYALISGEWRWVVPSPGIETMTIGKSVLKENPKIDTKLTVKSVGPLITDITKVRDGIKGQLVKLQGVVSVVPSVFGSQFFYMNNESAGVQVYQSKKDFPPIEVGDKVEVRGVVSEANGIKRINIKNAQSVDILSLNNSLPRIELNIADIVHENAGALVRVEGEITEIKSTFMFIDNGEAEIKVYFKKNAQIERKNLKEGGHVQVVGILEKIGEEWQVWPRSAEDIQVVEATSDAQVLGEKISVPESSMARKYILATIGGLSAFIVAFLVKFKSLTWIQWLQKVKAKFKKKDV